MGSGGVSGWRNRFSAAGERRESQVLTGSTELRKPALHALEVSSPCRHHVTTRIGPCNSHKRMGVDAPSLRKIQYLRYVRHVHNGKV